MSAPADLLTSTSPRFADVGEDITLCYETFGDPGDPTLLLLTGLGGQMIDWHGELCQQLVARGYHVVRLDNRDSGLSTHLPEPVDIQAVLRTIGAGQRPDVPYLLADMAADTVGLLDHLGVEQAHVVGISLGGMIAQELALTYPHRAASLISIMSRTGDNDAGMPTPEALKALLQPPTTTRQEAIDRAVVHSSIWGSAVAVEADVRAVQAARWDRHHSTDGSPRQFAAILASGSRTERLRSLRVPTLAIHGTQDALIQPAGSERLVEAVPGAKLLLIEGMGHDLARGLWPQLVEAITAHAAEHPPSGSVSTSAPASASASADGHDVT